MFEKNHKVFFVANTLVSFAMAIAGVFFNIFVYRYTDSSMESMLIFNIIKYIVVPLFFMCGAYLTQRVSVTKIYGLSMICYVAMIVVAVVSSALNILSPSLFILIIGIIWGAAEGLYWMVFNSLQQIIAEDSIRAKFIATYNGLGAIASIVAPLVSTLLIERFSENGYIIIFIIVAIFYMIAFGTIINIKIKEEEKKAVKFFDKKRYKKYRNFKRDILMNGMLGFKESIALSFLGILYINAFGDNDVFYGFFNTAIAIIGIGANFLAGKIYAHDHKKNWFIISSVITIIVGCIFGMYSSMNTAIIYGVVAGMFSALHYIPIAVKSFNLINKNSEDKTDMYVLVTIREAAINIGRILSLLIAYGLVKFISNGINVAFVISNISILVLVWLYLSYGE